MVVPMLRAARRGRSRGTATRTISGVSESSGPVDRAPGPAIAPGVHPVWLGRVQAHLVLEDEVSIIDAGYRGSLRRIEQALASHGRSRADLRRVICTHGHPDHAGGARELANSGSQVHIHPLDAEGLRHGWRSALRRPSKGRIFAAMTPALDAYTPMMDGDVLPVLGGLQVIHTQGHTPGSVCLYAARHGVLFVGDVLQRRGGVVSWASRLYSDDPSAARQVVQRLVGLDVETVVFSHYPPLTEGATGVIRQLAAAANA
jgi:glyoxylase-like metal-dependent hydrolase (beta-lactamase superfamily II)